MEALSIIGMGSPKCYGIHSCTLHPIEIQRLLRFVPLDLDCQNVGIEKA